MLVVEDVLICWMHRMRIVHLHAKVVSRDLYVSSGDCERGEVVVLLHARIASRRVLCVPGTIPALAGCCSQSPGRPPLVLPASHCSPLSLLPPTTKNHASRKLM